MGHAFGERVSGSIQLLLGVAAGSSYSVICCTKHEIEKVARNCCVKLPCAAPLSGSLVCIAWTLLTACLFGNDHSNWHGPMGCASFPLMDDEVAFCEGLGKVRGEESDDVVVWRV